MEEEEDEEKVYKSLSEKIESKVDADNSSSQSFPLFDLKKTSTDVDNNKNVANADADADVTRDVSSAVNDADVARDVAIADLDRAAENDSPKAQKLDSSEKSNGPSEKNNILSDKSNILSDKSNILSDKGNLLSDKSNLLSDKERILSRVSESINIRSLSGEASPRTPRLPGGKL